MTARLERFLDRMRSRGEAPCLIDGHGARSYSDLDRLRLRWLDVLASTGIGEGAVVGIRSDYSADAVALLLAVWSRRAVAALVPPSAPVADAYVREGRVEYLFDLASGEPAGERLAVDGGRHPLIESLRDSGSGGFVIFSSGSSGRPKAVLHAVERFLGKFDRPGKRLRTLGFLLFDHIAGIDTLFYTLGSGAALVVPAGRSVPEVCRAIEAHRVEVLPASPTFLNLLCLSGAYERFDLSSLEIVTYGSEPMSQATLDRLCAILPRTRVIQKYGTSEFGSPRALSRGRDSLWLRLKSDEMQAKVVDGILWVRTESAMLGYLNAPSPFDEEGWLCTGDAVEQDGEWIRFLGRTSDLVIVGGEKVYPQEVEEAILELESVEDVLVKGEPHPITGKILVAFVNVRDGDEASVRRVVRKHCRARLEPHKVPADVRIVGEPLATERQKKDRRQA